MYSKPRHHLHIEFGGIVIGLLLVAAAIAAFSQLQGAEVNDRNTFANLYNEWAAVENSTTPGVLNYRAAKLWERVEAEWRTMDKRVKQEYR